MDKLTSQTERLEERGNEFIYAFGKRLIRSFFCFKQRKGEFAAATVTFYTLMSFTPLLLMVLSIYSMIIGDQAVAFDQVFATLKGNFPNLAPWILKSIQKIVQVNITNQYHFSVGGALILLYGCIRFSSALNYGLHQMAKSEARGGKYIEALKSIFSISICALFLLGFIYLNSGLDLGPSENSSVMKKIFHWGHQKNLWQLIVGLCFFTFYYKFLTPIKVRVRDALMGSFSFAILFTAGKTFYWAYLKHFQAEMITNFGDFYTLVEAVIWIYYLACSFFFSATVVYDKVSQRTPSRPVSIPQEKVPDIPKKAA
ncbi:YihY/virulence factor BrkB family protein [bacterium]|nr:YihY/virulence factor BrkB family protein [bacterium]